MIYYVIETNDKTQYFVVVEERRTETGKFDIVSTEAKVMEYVNRWLHGNVVIKMTGLAPKERYSQLVKGGSAMEGVLFPYGPYDYTSYPGDGGVFGV